MVNIYKASKDIKKYAKNKKKWKSTKVNYPIRGYMVKMYNIYFDVFGGYVFQFWCGIPRR